jgi:hypothetical protein
LQLQRVGRIEHCLQAATLKGTSVGHRTHVTGPTRLLEQTDFSKARSGRHAVFAVALIIAIPLLLFRAPITGAGTWLGNPDRLVYGKFILHYIRGIAGGHLDAWNEREMLGYDTLIHPSIFPNPLTWLTAFLFDGPDLYAAEGRIAIVLLVLAGLAALAFLRTIGIGWFEAAVGAACYELCPLTILKLSQQADASFAEFAVLPLVLILVHNARRERAVAFFFGFVLAFAAMLHFMALQLVAYGFMLVGSYAVWRSCSTGRMAPLSLVAGAAIVAIVIASPRMLGIALSMPQYSRLTESADLSTFEGLYGFQNIRPREILRWFDPTIFGIGSAEATRLHNQINLSEGFLLSISAAVPLLLLLAMPRLYGHWDGLFVAKEHDTAFWSWVLVFTILVVVWKPMGHLLYLLFLRQDFTHARILIAGLLPICALIAIILGRLNPKAKSIAQLFGIVAGVMIVCLLEIAVRGFSGTIPLESLGLSEPARVRSMLSCALLGHLSCPPSSFVSLLFGEGAGAISQARPTPRSAL